MTKLGTLAALAASGVLAAAAFVRPPVSPAPKVATVAPKTTQPAKAATLPNLPAVVQPKAPPFAIAPAVSGRSFVVEEVVFAPWGNGVGELGVLRPREANPEGPMSLAVSDDGRIHVLDQVNERVSIFDPGGAPTQVVPIGSDTVQDIAIDPRGGWALLDRLVAREVRFLDPSGKLRSQVPVVGPGIPESGVVTALFAARDGFWLEVEHKDLVRVATIDGDPDPTRPVIEGRRASPGSPLLRAARDPAGYAVVSAIGPNGFLARVPFAAPVVELVGLEAHGTTTFVGAYVARETATEPFTLFDEKIEVVAIDGAGVEIGRFDLPPPAGPEEQLRSLVLSPNGQLHHLHVGATGATIRRAR